MLSVYVARAASRIVPDPPAALASCTAARSEQRPLESAQVPSPMDASTVSDAVLTWNEAAQAGGAPSRLSASPPSAAVVMVRNRM